MRLREAIRGIVDHSLGAIQRHIATKTASAGLASTAASSTPVEQAQPQQQPQQQQQQQAIAGANGYYHATNGDMTNGAAQTYTMASQNLQHPDHGHYQSEQPFYPDPQSTTMPSYASASLQAYTNASYTADDMKPNIEAQLNAGLQQYATQQPQPTPPTFNSHTHPPPQDSYHNTTPQAGPTAWRDFTQGVMTNMPSGSDYAATLMALQNPAHAAKDGTADMHPHSNMTMAALGGMQIPPQVNGGQPWPLIHYGSQGTNAPGQ